MGTALPNIHEIGQEEEEDPNDEREATICQTKIKPSAVISRQVHGIVGKTTLVDFLLCSGSPVQMETDARLLSCPLQIRSSNGSLWGTSKTQIKTNCRKKKESVETVNKGRAMISPE